MADKNKKLSRWYFGGVSSAAAACVTHPLDLLKVLFPHYSQLGYTAKNCDICKLINELKFKL